MLKPLPKKIVYLDLFSGTGGFALGLKQAGFVFKKHYYSEIDNHAAGNYQYNFPHAQQLGDIKKISGTQIERPDIISFGSPCQDISLAGKQTGLKGKRSGLFFEAIRLIRIYKPRVFIFENVKGLFSSNSGKDFEAVLRAFADLGLYDIQWQMLNTAWFLPQNRERVYFVGHLRGTACPQIFPIGESPELSETFPATGTGGGKNIASAITSNYSKGVHARGETYVQMLHWKNSKERWVQEAKDKVPTLKTQSDLTRQPLIISSGIRKVTAKAKVSARSTPEQTMAMLRKGGIRRLTPVECERLQGFPDNWTAYGLYNGEQKEIPETQRYKMLGNAVSVIVVLAVATRLLSNKNQLGSLQMIYPEQPEIVLGSVTPEISIPELSLSYTRNIQPFLGFIYKAGDVAAFIRSTFNEGEVELQEHFTVLFLNTAREIIGYYKHSKGMINATMADTRIILAAALKCLATAIIISHNHPSGNRNPSEADRQLTEKIKEAARFMSIELLDHIIVTRDSYYSFGDNRLAGLEPLADKTTQFVEIVKRDLLAKVPHNKRSMERIAAGLNISDQTEVKELTELAIVETARDIAQEEGFFVDEKYKRIVALYHNQVNLSHRTSQSILLQQYSTPAPIGYLMGIFCGIDQLHKKGGYAFEPSAGNGLLTIAAKPERVYVNEIDDLRRRNLKAQGYANVWDRDATKPFFDVRRNFMAVLTNPPFGMLDTKMVFDGYPIQPLEHVMAIQALDCMMDDGKAAIIIGGHTRWDAKGRIQAGKNRLFFNYLYHHYDVADVIPINGKKLYSRQGTGFDTRIILISGRKEKPAGAAPVYDKIRDVVLNSFDDLFIRVMEAMEKGNEQQTDAHLSQLAKNYEQKYLPLQRQYKDQLILLRNGIHYEVYGHDVMDVTGKHVADVARITNTPLSAHFTYKGKGILLVRLPAEGRQWISDALRKAGLNFIMADVLQTPAQRELETMEEEAKQLLQALRSVPLGSSNDPSTEREYANRYNNRYIHLQETYNGELIFLRYRDNYEVYGRDAGLLNHLLSLKPSEHFKDGDEHVFVTIIPASDVGGIIQKLKAHSYRYILSDFKEQSFPALRPAHDPNKQQPLWEIPLAKFIRTEEKLYQAAVVSAKTWPAYDLPYKPEYVGLFNNILNHDPYKPSDRNPYSSAGSRELDNSVFRTVCLKAIHEYEILLGMSLDIILPDEVLEDYPKHKLKQDARIVI